MLAKIIGIQNNLLKIKNGAVFCKFHIHSLSYFIGVYLMILPRHMFDVLDR